MSFLMILTTLLAFTNLAILLLLNISNLIDSFAWKKERKRIDEEFDKILKDMLENSKVQAEENKVPESN